MNSSVYTAIAATGIAAVVVLSIISTTGIKTTYGIAVPENVTGSNEATGEQVEDEFVMHLDNAERQVMQGNSTGAILELIAALRLEHVTGGVGPLASIPQ
jgi:hypothetical protein